MRGKNSSYRGHAELCAGGKVRLSIERGDTTTDGIDKFAVTLERSSSAGNVEVTAASAIFGDGVVGTVVANVLNEDRNYTKLRMDCLNRMEFWLEVVVPETAVAHLA